MFPYFCTVLVRMSVNQMDAQPFLLRRENNVGQCSLVCENSVLENGMLLCSCLSVIRFNVTMFWFLLPKHSKHLIYEYFRSGSQSAVQLLSCSMLLWQDSVLMAKFWRIQACCGWLDAAVFHWRYHPGKMHLSKGLPWRLWVPYESQIKKIQLQWSAINIGNVESLPAECF